jgi:PAS domain-containing protein
VRPNVESTQLIARPVWENPRVHLLDDIWLMTIVAILVATGVPWFASGFEVEIGMASWGLLALGGLHVAFTMLAAPAHSPGRWRERSLTLLDIVGVCLVAFIWQHVGGLQNPMFLTVFALPVVGAIFLSRWHPYLVALVGVLAVGVVALSQAPELRWYASGLFGSDAWLTWLFGNQSAVPQPSFSGFYAPSNYLIVLLEVFAIMLFGCAVAAEYVGTIFERLNAHIVMARTEAERGQEMWAGLIERLPLPALLIDPDTLRVVASSEFATIYLRANEMPLEGRPVFEAVKLSYPDVVHELIVGSDGAAPVSVVRIADQLRVTNIRVLHVAHKGRRLALVTIEDATEVFCLKAALDTAEYATLVIDARGFVLAFNKPAGALFNGAEIGGDAAQLLTQAQPEAAPRWWEPGLTGRRKMHVQIGPRIYQVTSSAVALAGEEERIFTVAFLPVARAGQADPFATGATVVTTTLSQLR